jgi:hypothetical protein
MGGRALLFVGMLDREWVLKAWLKEGRLWAWVATEPWLLAIGMVVGEEEQQLMCFKNSSVPCQSETDYHQRHFSPSSTPASSPYDIYFPFETTVIRLIRSWENISA